MQLPLATTADDLDAKLAPFLSRWKAVGRPNIERFAFRFCERFGVHDIPRDPRLYLPHLGVRIAHGVPRAGRASWIRTDTYEIRAPVHLDAKLGLTLWHEFFEMMSAHPSFPSALPCPFEENLAGKFAVHVMMPESDVRLQAAELHHPEVNKSFVLASRFGVSKTAILIRLKELGLEAGGGMKTP